MTPLSQARPDLPPAYIALVDQILDPDPARRPISADAVQSALAPIATPPVARPLHMWKWITAALGVVLAALVVWRAAAPAPIRSIAVLPIRNLTGDPDKTYIADGLTTVLISNLAHIASLRVPSFEAVAPLRGRDDPPVDAAKKLGVQLLLAGSITQADTRFRMSVQLIDPATGAAIWGEEITRESPGMMSAQADIARFVAERLGLDLSRTERRALQPQALSPQVQDIYLRALALRTTLPAARRESARLFRQATELEPTFAAAWAELALVEIALIAESPTAERMARSALVRQMADRAIQLDPSLAAGYAALGTIQFYDNWDFASAEKTLQHALTVDPSAGFPRQRLSMLLAARGRLDEAVRIAQDAVRLEPLVPGRAITLGGIYYYAREYDRAESEARRALQLSPDFPTAYFLLGQIAAAKGQYDDAIGHVRRALGGSNYMGWLADLARICAAAGRRDEVQTILTELDLRQQAGESYSPDNLAYIAVAEGRFDEAFRVLDDAVDRHLVNVLWIAVDPRVDPLRHDPRFARLLAKTGLQ